MTLPGRTDAGEWNVADRRGAGPIGLDCWNRADAKKETSRGMRLTTGDPKGIQGSRRCAIQGEVMS